MSTKIHSLIMAGGQGTRFWPESTSKKPKQYLSLVGENSLLTETLLRFKNLSSCDERYIITVKAQEELATQHSKDLVSEGNIIFEPAGRNTAPCILLSLAALKKKGAADDDIVCIVPSDHIILNKDGFEKTIKAASHLATKNASIVTIGINPNFPHTGFGYIKKGSDIGDDGFSVESFKEKPDFDTAKKYVTSGEYFWNAGMFVSTIGTLMNEFKICSPETFSHFENLLSSLDDEKSLEEAYSKIPSDSIDYAIMEKSKNIQVTAAQFDWNDLGSWDALEEVLEKKESNTIIGDKMLYTDNSKGNIVYAPGKFISLINVNDLIIIDNDKSLVVLPKSDSQKVKDIVGFLKDKDEKDFL